MFQVFNNFSRAGSYVLGALILSLATVAATSGMSVSAIAQWAQEIFGISFIVLISLLIFLVLLSCSQMFQSVKSGENCVFWNETGEHSANAVATLALTYTLLGISLGIGTLADQELTPQTIQPVIRGLTEHFSLAFMTTVVGLPTAAILRAIVAITNVHLTSAQTASLKMQNQLRG